MKEQKLRTMIRNQIKSSLKEATLGDPRQQVTKTLGRVEKMAGVKMLKKALPTNKDGGMVKKYMGGGSVHNNKKQYGTQGYRAARKPK